MTVSEYDAFGPWIYEITEEHPLPKLFVPYVNMEEPCLMMFKIPREIERRRASPDMPLYDYLIAAYSDRICIWHRSDNNVEETIVNYNKIQGIQLYRNILMGTCILYLTDKVAAIPFNTVSMKTIFRFSKIIRSRSAADSQASIMTVKCLENVTIPDVLLINLLRELREDGEILKLYAEQSSIVVKSSEESFYQKIRHLLRPERISGSLHLLNKHELIILQAGSGALCHGKQNYGYSYIYLPLNNIQEIQIGENIPYQNAVKVSLKLHDQKVFFCFQKENQPAIDFYSALSK